MRSFRQRLLAGIFVVSVLAIAPANSQTNFPGKGDDTTSSLGSFKIQIATNFQATVNGCPAMIPPPESGPAPQCLMVQPQRPHHRRQRG